MKRLILLRHTQTAFNKPPIRLRGDLDIPLSPEGFAQIPQVAEKLKTVHPDVKQVYSSPLERASILAAAVAHEYELKVQRLPELKSWGYGVLNGRYVEDVVDVLKTLTTGAGRELAPKGGESMNDFLARLAEGVKHIISEAPEEGCVVVCTHLQNILMARAYLELGLPEDVRLMPYEYHESNEISPGSWMEIKRQWLTLQESTS